ncbi:MAG: hypothetical protein ABIH49_00820 [archaeon]
MRNYNTINYKGKEWRYVYLDPDPSIDERVVDGVMWNVVDMHKRDLEIKSVNTELYEARIEMHNRAAMGTFVGKVFKAELESLTGKSKLGILLLDTLSEMREAPVLN